VSVITAIKPQRNRRRVNIYLDGKFGFGVDLENFVKLGLKVEQELSKEEIIKIVKKSEFQKTLNKLLRFATVRPRSLYEIKRWMKRKEVHESLEEELFNRLKSLDLTDEEKFAEWWIEQRNNFRPMGKFRLRQELMQKGINKDIINDKLALLIDTDAQKEFAVKLLSKKENQLRKIEYHKAYQKAYGYLARRGFDNETIKHAIDEIGLRE